MSHILRPIPGIPAQWLHFRSLGPYVLIMNMTTRETTKTAATVATCNCCGATYTAESWKTLQFVGVWSYEDVGTYESRNCPCHGTLSVEVKS